MSPIAPAAERNARDPTRTLTLRASYAAASRKRFRLIKGAVLDGVARADVLGIGANPPRPPVLLAAEPPEVRKVLNALRQRIRSLQERASEATGAARQALLAEATQAARSFLSVPGRFAFPSDAAKLTAMDGWISEMTDTGVLEVVRNASGEVVEAGGWQQIFVRRAYVKGFSHATVQLRKAGVDVPTRYDNVQRTLSLPIHRDALDLLYARNLSELEGVTAATGQEMRRKLAEGFASGLNPRETARRLNGAVDGIGIRRAELIARTETIRAHARGTLRRFEQFGVSKVKAEVEFATAGDDRVSNARWSIVETVDGPRPIQSVRPGDKVWTRDGLREVVATSVRPYSGGLVRIGVGERSEVCTIQHPVWTREEGWLEAADIEVGHTVETFDEGAVEITDLRHFEIGDAHHRQSLLAKAVRLPLVALRRLLVPVETIHLQGDVEVRKQKVDRISADSGFLAELKAKVEQAVPYEAFRRGLAFVGTVAGERAESNLVSALRAAKHGAAVVARMFLDAITPSRCSATPVRAVPVPSLICGPDGERLFTLGAESGDLVAVSSPRGVTAPRTESMSVIPAIGSVGLLAPLAGRVRDVALPLPVALPRAEDVLGAQVPSWIRTARERLSALVADQVKRHWWNLRRWGHITACKLLGEMPVYNLQVEGPEEYYSSGILVKNCPICDSLDGVVFSIKDAQDVIPVHPDCRCAWLPAFDPGDVSLNRDVVAEVLDRARSSWPSWYWRSAA